MSDIWTTAAAARRARWTPEDEARVTAKMAAERERHDKWEAEHPRAEELDEEEDDDS